MSYLGIRLLKLSAATESLIKVDEGACLRQTACDEGCLSGQKALLSSQDFEIGACRVAEEILSVFDRFLEVFDLLGEQEFFFGALLVDCQSVADLG